MRIRNNMQRNTSVYAQHTGSGIPERISIPAGSVLELSDEAWEKFAEPAKGQIDAGFLEITAVFRASSSIFLSSSFSAQLHPM